MFLFFPFLSCDLLACLPARLPTLHVETPTPLTPLHTALLFCTCAFLPFHSWLAFITIHSTHLSLSITLRRLDSLNVRVENTFVYPSSVSVSSVSSRQLSSAPHSLPFDSDRRWRLESESVSEAALTIGIHVIWYITIDRMTRITSFCPLWKCRLDFLPFGGLVWVEARHHRYYSTAPYWVYTVVGLFYYLPPLVSLSSHARPLPLHRSTFN